MKEFCKSTRNWQSYSHGYGDTLFWLTVYIVFYSLCWYLKTLIDTIVKFAAFRGETQEFAVVWVKFANFCESCDGREKFSALLTIILALYNFQTLLPGRRAGCATAELRLRPYLFVHLHTVSENGDTRLLVSHNFGKHRPILLFYHWHLNKTDYNREFHLASTALLHCFAKFENYK